MLTVTPVPYELAGEARPAGRFLVQRGDAPWLLDLAAGTETQLPVSGVWGYAHDGPGDDLYFVELVARVERQFTSRLIRVNGVSRAELFTFDAGAWYGWAAAVSPDGSGVAYLTPQGLRLRILASGQDILVAANDSSGCRSGLPFEQMRLACFRYYRVQWTSDGQYILATRIEYEPSTVYAFEARFSAQPGVRLATVPGTGYASSSDHLVVRNRYCSDGSANFGGAGSELIVYDLLAPKGRKLGRPSETTTAEGCVPAASGEVAAQWVFKSLHEYSESTLQLYDPDLEPGMTVAVPPMAKLCDWLRDQSGLVFLPPAPGYRFARDYPAKYLLVDRAGKWWTFPIVADRLLAILP